MCGRFSLTVPLQAVREHFSARPEPLGGAPEPMTIDRNRYNVRPTEWIWAVARGDDGARIVSPMRWGFLPHWAKALTASAPLINARSETIAEKPAFAKSVRERRCLVPADGFYEWRTVETGAKKPVKEPHWISAPTTPLLAFAGVWRVWRGPNGEDVPSVAIVTAAATGPIAALHERTPVPIAPEAYGLWLGEEGHGAARLMRAPDAAFFVHHPVSSLINKGGRMAPDGPELRAPVDPASDAPPPGALL